MTGCVTARGTHNQLAGTLTQEERRGNKMRFGCCGNLVATGADKTGIEIIEKIAEYGYDYIELPLAEMMDLERDVFDQLKTRIKNSGLCCEVCNNLFPARIRLTGADVDMETIKEYARKALARAGELGVTTVVFGSGTAKNVPEGFPMERAYEQVVEITRLLAPIARDNGITIVIEPIRKPECNIINSFQEGVMLAEEIHDENIRVLVDYYHMVWETESPEILMKYGKEYLRHVHFANPNLSGEEGRIYPAKTSEWDYGAFIETLHKIHYEGRVSIEAGAADFDRQAKVALEFLHNNL